MTYRQLVWRSYWRYVFGFFGLMMGLSVLVNITHSTPEAYRGQVSLASFALMLVLIVLKGRSFMDWIKEYDKPLRSKTPLERPRPEDFIWNHPWPTAIKMLLWNLVMAAVWIGCFVAWAALMLLLVLAPIITGLQAYMTIFGTQMEDNWLALAFTTPFAFASTCGLGVLVSTSDLIDKRMLSNPVVTQP